MTRIRFMLVALGAAAALVIPTAATPAPGTVLVGTVGPGPTITLKKGSKRVTVLKAGKYTVRVSDKSDDHSFAFKGALRKTVTTEDFVGTKTVTVIFRKGKVTYFCAPHASFMKGAFTVQ